jgi:hypothetical protein
MTFTILVDPWTEDWFPIDLCLDDVASVVDLYLRNEQATCCTYQGGFFITVDGEVWSDSGTVDEFRMTMTWFNALARLCEGALSAQVWAWEESALTLTRDGDWLEMEDIHHSGHVCLPRLRVPLVPFVEEVLREGERFAVFVRLVRAEVDRRKEAGADPTLTGHLDEIAWHLPVGVEQQLAGLRASVSSRSPS